MEVKEKLRNMATEQRPRALRRLLRIATQPSLTCGYHYLKKLGCLANCILLPLIRHSLGDLRKLWKIDYYFKMKLVLELLESQGENERIATYHGLFERLDGLPLPPLLVPG